MNHYNISYKHITCTIRLYTTPRFLNIDAAPTALSPSSCTTMSPIPYHTSPLGTSREKRTVGHKQRVRDVWGGRGVGEGGGRTMVTRMCKPI